MSTELALRAFEADAAFSASLAELQEQLTDQPIVEALALANQHGFSWMFRPAGDGLTEAVLRHSGGSEEKALGDEPLNLVLGLLGALPGAQAAEPETMQDLHNSEPVEPAAGTDSLLAKAAAEVALQLDAEPAPGAERAQDDALSDDEKAVAVGMIRVMDAGQRKAFTIAFRHAFQVPSTERAIQPLITELRHLQFIDRFTVEAAGGVAA